MTSPLEVYRTFQQYLLSGTLDRMHEVVDLEAYTENCVGLTPGWITGFQNALGHYLQNVASSMGDVETTEESVVVGADSVVIRSRIEATHVGLLLGLPATGRRFTYEAVDLLRLQGGRIVWRWLLCDLYAVERQLNLPGAGQETENI